MALIKCSECTKEISDKASACPQCGAPVEKTEYTKIEQKFTQETIRSPQNPQTKEVTSAPESKKSNSWKTITIILVIVLAGIAFLFMQNNPGIVPSIKVDMNPPNPVVITSRADAANSSLIKLKETVYVTVQNQGGDGNVLITFRVFQGGNDYKRSQSIYMKAGDQIDLSETFTEVKLLDGQITYDVNARAEL
jgi:hypothetical protein